MNDVVLYEKRDAVASLTLNRPESLNAINADMRERLPQRLIEAENDADVKVILLRGAGERGFCAGADVKSFGRVEAPAEYRRMRRDGHFIRPFEKLTKPVIAAIHGFCLGGGLEIALACDIRIAADDALFALPEVSLGTIPGAGGTQRLARVVGMGLALDMTLTAQRINAQRAYEIGLISRLCARADLVSTAMNLAIQVAALAPLGLRHAKEAVVKGADLPLSDGLALELDLLSLLLTTEDRVEASNAFREKRKPIFKGR